MKNTIKLFAILILLFSSLSTISAADVIVYLKDGGRIKGEIVTETIDTITVRNEFGDLELERLNIKRIVREGSSVLPYDKSVYSFKKKTWSKFAGFGSVAVGIIATSITADSDSRSIPIYTGVGFGVLAVTFFSLDFFMYGRIPKKRRTKFSSFLMPNLRERLDYVPNYTNPQHKEERREVYYSTRF